MKSEQQTQVESVVAAHSEGEMTWVVNGSAVALLLLMLILLFLTAEAVPRLKVREGTTSVKHSMLRVNRNVTVTCVDCSVATWTLPKDCETVVNRTVELVIRCEASGLKTFALESEGVSMSFRLNFVRDDYHCFAWTACALDGFSGCKLNPRMIEQSSVNSRQVRMLVQLEAIDGSTNHSRNTLTQSLVEMGELPEVSVVRRRLFPQAIASDPIYNVELKGWVVNVSLDHTGAIPGLPITLRVEGRANFLMGCFVQEREITFHVAKYPLLPIMEALPISVNSVEKVVNDPCAWDLLYAINRSSSAMLLSKRRESAIVDFNHVYFGSSGIMDVAPIRLGVVVLAGTDIFRLTHDSLSPSLVASGINADYLSSARSCRRKIDNVNDMVAAWSAGATDVIFVSTGLEQPFEPIPLPTSLHILDVLPLFGPNMLLILARGNAHEVFVLQYDIRGHSWGMAQTFNNLTKLPARQVNHPTITWNLPFIRYRV